MLDRLQEGRHTFLHATQLILNYSPLVKYVAGRVAVGLPANIEQADLISYGIFGLIDAIDKYELDRGIKFETYAISRIRGAIIDELRAIDWVPRSVRFKAREVEKAYTSLENKLKRPPSDAEIAEEMGITMDELSRIYTQLSTVSLVALDELMSVDGERGDRLSLVETLEDTKTTGPVDARRGRGDEGHPRRGPSTGSPSGRKSSSRSTTTRV